MLLTIRFPYVMMAAIGICLVLGWVAFENLRHRYPIVKVLTDDESSASRVNLYSPMFEREQSKKIKVLWDGNIIFSQYLPIAKETNVTGGAPCKFLTIVASKGKHALEVWHENNMQRVDVVLDEQRERSYKIFNYKDGEEVLLRELPAGGGFR